MLPLYWLLQMVRRSSPLGYCWKEADPISCIFSVLVSRGYKKTYPLIVKRRECSSWGCGQALILKMGTSAKFFFKNYKLLDAVWLKSPINYRKVPWANGHGTIEILHYLLLFISMFVLNATGGANLQIIIKACKVLLKFSLLELERKRETNQPFVKVQLKWITNTVF